MIKPIQPTMFPLQCARGFSLVELMVGILISVIGTLAMLTAFAKFEGQKRTTTAGNDAQENGTFAAYELEREIRSAGSGFVQGKNYSFPGCPVSARLGGSTVLPHAGPFAAPFASFPAAVQVIPVLIQAGTGPATATTPDTIAVIGGNPGIRVFQAAVQVGTTATSLVVDNGIGILAGDYLAGAPNAGTCAIANVSAVASAAPPTFTFLAMNAPVGGFVGTPNVLDVGPTPTFALFGIDTTVTPNTLDRYDMLAGAAPAGIADGVVMLKALYGVDDGATTASIPGSGVSGDGIVDEWVQPIGATWGYAALMARTPAALLSISQIKAIRLVVVSQSELPERAKDYTGAVSLDLFADLGTLKYTMTTLPQYRYRVYDETIPIRNAFVTRFF